MSTAEPRRDPQRQPQREPALAWNGVRISYRVADERAQGSPESDPAARTGADSVRDRKGSDRRIVAVDGVSLSVPAGGTVGVAGESGCGKSTLALSALRLLPRNAVIEGTIELAGEDVATMRWGRLRAVRWTEAAIVFQGAMHSLNPVRTVGHQIVEALQVHDRPGSGANGLSNGHNKEQAAARVAELLALVDLPAARAAAYPHELSGGQKQRIMIAMALACDPDVIIADEPTTALDVVVQAQVLEVLSALVRERRLTLIMISHDLSVLASVCERIVIMRDGKIVEDGPSAEVIGNPQHEHTRELAAAFPTIGDPASRLRVGRAVRATPTPVTTTTTSSTEKSAETRPDAVGAALLEVDGLTVDFRARGRNTRAVDGVSLTCHAGEIVALVGQSGSGKTTLARTVLGLQRPTSGRVSYQGKPLPSDRAGLKAYRRAVQFVLQDPSASLNPKHSVYEAVAEGIRIHTLPGDERALVAAAMAKAELTPPERYASAIPQELSGGQRQRVVIAGALALEPSFLVADEPVASLDASVRGEILALLLQLKRDLGLGALVITHDLGLAWNIADRVLVMHQGRIVESGPVEQVLLDPQHDYTKKLLSVVPTGPVRKS